MRSRWRARTPSTSRSSSRASEVDEIYLDESYYIVPNDKVAYEAFAVIREAMKKEDLVGLARVVLYRRERILMLQPRGKGLMATALRYNSEVRDEENYFDEIPDSQGAGRHAQSRRPHPGEQEGEVRPRQVRGPLRERAVRTDPGQAGRQAGAEGVRAQAEQRHQPDGRAASKSVNAEKGGKGARRARRAPATAAPPHSRKRAASTRSKVKRAG